MGEYPHEDLVRQLQKQPDPTLGDQIFGTQIHMMEEACSLTDIFGSQLRTNRHRRGSSGCWDMDRLTQQEEKEYLDSHGASN